MKMFWWSAHSERVQAHVRVRTSDQSHVSNVVALIRYFGLRMALIFFLIKGKTGGSSFLFDQEQSWISTKIYDVQDHLSMQLNKAK